LVVGAVIIKHKLCLSDEETIDQIRENPYLQYFVGLTTFQTKAPFTPSLFVEIRRRMGDDVFEKFNQAIIMDALIERHTGEAVFTFEWFKSRYLEDGLYAPLVTDIVSCKFEDSYFDGRVKTTVKEIFDMKHGGGGLLAGDRV